MRIIEGCTIKQKRIFSTDLRDCDVFAKYDRVPFLGTRFSFAVLIVAVVS